MKRCLSRCYGALKSTYGWKSPIEKTKGKELSLVLWAVALAMFLLRLTWVSQFIKFLYRFFKSPNNDIPPVTLELYILVSLIIEVSTALACQFHFAAIQLSAWTLACICIWKIIENITSNVYYLLLRTVLELKAPHSSARSFIMAVLALIEVWLLLCLTWFFIGKTSPRLDSMVTAIYFASTTFFTVGYGEISPDGGPSRMLAIFTMFCSTTMLAVVLSRALSLVRPLPAPADHP